MSITPALFSFRIDLHAAVEDGINGRNFACGTVHGKSHADEFVGISSFRVIVIAFTSSIWLFGIDQRAYGYAVAVIENVATPVVLS